MKLFDLTEDGAIQEWEEMLDLKAKLSYGFLDELIENAVFNRLKGFRGKPGKPDKIGKLTERREVNGCRYQNS